MVMTKDIKIGDALFVRNGNSNGRVRITDILRPNEDKNSIQICYQYLYCEDASKIHTTYVCGMEHIDMFEEIVTHKFKIGDLLVSSQGNSFTVTGFEERNNKVVVLSGRSSDKDDRRRYAYKPQELKVMSKVCRLYSNGVFKFILAAKDGNNVFTDVVYGNNFELIQPVIKHLESKGYVYVK